MLCNNHYKSRYKLRCLIIRHPGIIYKILLGMFIKKYRNNEKVQRNNRSIFKSIQA